MLSSIFKANKVTLTWSKGNKHNTGNSRADELARECAFGSYEPKPFIRLTLNTLGSLINIANRERHIPAYRLA